MTNVGRLLDVLGEPTRRSIFERLANAPSSVGDLAEGLPVSRSAVSQHLTVLKSAGLVTDRAVGTRRVYSVDPQALRLIRAYFDAFWTRSLDAFQTAAERADQTNQEDP